MANATKRSRIKCVTGNATLAEVKADKIILPPYPGGAYVIVGGWMRALGGAAGTATTVNISDTTGTAVVGVAIARAALAENAIAQFDAAANVTRTTFGTAFAAGKGLKICDAGAVLDTCTSVDYCVMYQTVSG